MPDIVTLTLNPALDKTCTVKQVMPEHKLRCSNLDYHPGGGGLNVARAVHKLGGDATAYWTCGGVIGQRLRELLDAAEIEHHPLEIEDLTRENLIVLEESSAQQFRFGMPGAKLSEPEIQHCLELVSKLDPPPEFLVLSGSLPPGVEDDLYTRIIDAAPSGAKIILDTSGKPLQLAAQRGVYLLKPNKRELGQLADQTIEDDSQIHEVARQLIDQGQAEVVITSLGSGGAVLTTAEANEHVRTPTVDIRSKVGAGDSMVGGIVLALARQKSVTEAVRFGVAAGAAAVMTEGTELCRREDTERLYEQMSSSREGQSSSSAS